MILFQIRNISKTTFLSLMKNSESAKKILGKQHQGGVFTGDLGTLTNIVISTGSDRYGLGCWNWIKLKESTKSTFLITEEKQIRVVYWMHES